MEIKYPFVIKNVKSGHFAKHTGKDELYPWTTVESINDAQEYETIDHANEIAFWHMAIHEKWIVVDKRDLEEHPITTGKYLPA
ncbi:hypothetical protein [Terribacillus saccharophilus]|uniref:hypothetical protein n=1 Tax=Terribacillus saccharophilus TaxID=361277 RepID=UPI000BA60972|nr:hypothetical protein [Terribacillus saccharophilus]PAF19718.1 hypothetical protein CHH51_01250 [Terribacillus saccharophilus]